MKAVEKRGTYFYYTDALILFIYLFIYLFIFFAICSHPPQRPWGKIGVHTLTIEGLIASQHEKADLLQSVPQKKK